MACGYADSSPITSACAYDPVLLLLWCGWLSGISVDGTPVCRLHLKEFVVQQIQPKEAKSTVVRGLRPSCMIAGWAGCSGRHNHAAVVTHSFRGSAH